MNITCIAFGIVFLVVGILFFFGLIHKYSRIWKSMSNDEKNKIKIKPLCKNIGIVICLSGVLFLVGGFVPYFRENYFAISIICWLVFAGMDVYYIAKSKTYRNFPNINEEIENEKERK